MNIAPYPSFDGTQTCQGMDPEVFFPTDNTDRVIDSPEAIRACRQCPFIRGCLAYALTHPVVGIWGGTTTAERDSIRRANRIRLAREELLEGEETDGDVARRLHRGGRRVRDCCRARGLPRLRPPLHRHRTPARSHPMTTDIDDLVATVLDDQAAAESDVSRPAQTYVDAVPVTAIEVDHTYQRELNRKRVEKMVAEFDPSLVGVLEVSKRDDGTYRVIDGQHRLFTVRAAHPLGTRAAIACNVHTGLTPEQEAQLFFDIDRKRSRLTGWDRWNARRGAGEAAVLEIEATAAKHGLVIDPAAKPMHLRCVAACEKLVELAGMQVLDEALGMAVKAYSGEVDSLRAEIVHGLGLVLAYYPADDLDRDRLLRAMEGIAPRQLSARAAALRETQNGQLPRLAAHVIVDRYNALPGPKAQAFLKRVPAASRTAPTKQEIS